MEQTRDAMQAYLHTPDEHTNDSGTCIYTNIRICIDRYLDI
jgi:hypothetical protein